MQEEVRREKMFGNIASRIKLLLCTLMLVVTTLTVGLTSQALAWETLKFEKTAKRVCDEITYNIHIEIAASGKDDLPYTLWDPKIVGLLPLSSPTDVKFISTPAVVASTTLNANGWSTSFSLPKATLPYTAIIDVSFTTRIDPAAIGNSDIKISNQAALKFLKVSEHIVSKDPAKPGSPVTPQGSFVKSEWPTDIVVPIAELKQCMKKDDVVISSNSVSGSCFSPDPKVTCGKTPGTYVITLNAQTMGPSAPTEVTLTSLTPGVSIVNPQTSYAVNASGQVQVTVAGATPGQSIEFDISGSNGAPDPKTGLNVCCAGKIKIEIPKDLPCDIKPRIEVSKSCLPAKPNGNSGYSAICQITVKSWGVHPNPVTILEKLLGNGTVTYVSATDPWSCVPSSVTSPAPMSCTLPGNTLNPITDTSVIDVKVDFKNAGDVKEAKNCAAHLISDSKRGVPSCVHFTIEEKSTVEVEKKCGPASLRKYPIGPTATGLGYVSQCTITLKTTGPQTGTLSVNDGLSGGTLLGFASISTPAWNCLGNNCSIAGSSLNQTASVSTFNASVALANPGAVKDGRNCAIVKRGPRALDRGCVTFEIDEPPKEPEVAITKVCEPAKQLDSPVLQFGSKCTITVTTTGPVQTNLVVSENLVGNGQVTSFTNTSTPAWTCIPGQCDMDGSNLNQTSSVSTFEAMVTFPAGQGADQASARNCAKLGMDAHVRILLARRHPMAISRSPRPAPRPNPRKVRCLVPMSQSVRSRSQRQDHNQGRSLSMMCYQASQALPSRP
jgi:hypothetical protein